MEQRPLHWSDRAKMYPSDPGKVHATPGAPRPPRQSSRFGRKQRKPVKSRLRSRIVLAVLFLAAVGVGIYFLLDARSEDGPDEEAELAARNLVRTAMTTIERAYADARTYDPRAMSPDTLQSLEPSISFYKTADEGAATSPTAQAKDQGVSYSGTQTSYAVGTLSPAGIAYGVVVDKEADTVTYYLDGGAVDNWSTETGTDTSSASTTLQTTQSSQTSAGPLSAAADVAAQSVVRDSMTTVESAYVGLQTFEPTVMTPAVLDGLEPSVTFIPRQDDSAATAPISLATEGVIDFFGTATSYSLGTISDSGNSFGVTVTIDSRGRTTAYYRNGESYDWGSAD